MSDFSNYLLSTNPDQWLRLGDSSGSVASDSSGNSKDGSYEGTFTLNQDSLVANDSTTSVLLGSDGKVNLGDITTFANAGTLGYDMRHSFSPASDYELGTPREVFIDAHDGVNGVLVAHNGEGVLTEPRLLDPDGDAGDQYARACAMSGNGLVGAIAIPRWDNGTTNIGAVQLYDRADLKSPWVKRGVPLPCPIALDVYFGTDVALNYDGSVLGVSAQWYSPTFTNQGGIWVWDLVKATDTRTLRATSETNGAIISPAPVAEQTFGSSLDFDDSGDVMLVGANDAGLGTGRAWLLDSNMNEWDVRGGVITASDAVSGDGFGVSTALNGTATIAAIGANSREEAGELDRGGIYTIDINGSTYTERAQILTAPDAGDSDSFGRSLALNQIGDILLGGAQFWDGDYTNQGVVYSFKISGVTWTYKGQITEPDAAQDNVFGRGLDCDSSGLYALFGASGYDGATSDEGAAYSYILSCIEYIHGSETDLTPIEFAAGSINRICPQYNSTTKEMSLYNNAVLLGSHTFTNALVMPVTGTFYLEGQRTVQDWTYKDGPTNLEDVLKDYEVFVSIRLLVDKLRLLGYTGTIQDMKKSWLVDEGYTGNLVDMEKRFLVNLGYSGSIPGMYKDKATSDGYNSLNKFLIETWLL